MIRAHETIRDVIRGIDYEQRPHEWKFLNDVLMAAVPHAQIESAQNGLLLSVLQEVALGMHTETVNDRQRSLQWAVQIATLINGAHAAYWCR